MGRKGEASEIELRHQRTADVFFSPALAPGRCPDEARAMLETLLPGAGVGAAAAARPGAGVGAAAAARPGAPRLLEICLATGEPAQLQGRPGWVTLVAAGV